MSPEFTRTKLPNRTRKQILHQFSRHLPTNKSWVGLDIHQEPPAILKGPKLSENQVITNNA